MALQRRPTYHIGTVDHEALATYIFLCGFSTKTECLAGVRPEKPLLKSAIGERLNACHIIVIAIVLRPSIVAARVHALQTGRVSSLDSTSDNSIRSGTALSFL